MYQFEWIDVLIVNETEAVGLLTEVGKYKQIEGKDLVKSLSDTLPVDLVILTLGSAGAYAVEKSSNFMEFIAAPLTHAIDTTGAGDAFVGMFVTCYLGGHLSLKESLTLAVKIASKSCESQGTFEASFN